MTLYIGNAFSLQMLAEWRAEPGTETPLTITSLGRPEPARAYILEAEKRHGQVKPCIGHADTARIVSQELDLPIPASRRSIVLHDDDELIIAQYTGPRLPEGATKLPDGAFLTWWLVTVG